VARERPNLKHLPRDARSEASDFATVAGPFDTSDLSFTSDVPVARHAHSAGCVERTAIGMDVAL
jgi:hypothetical protein